jgi:hypothetical protein
MPIATRHIQTRRPHHSPDRQWEFVRGPFGWLTIHCPTHWSTGWLDAYLRDARTNADNPAIYARMWNQAWRSLRQVEDVITYEDGTTISSHDHARGVLTWLDEHHPELFATQE